MPLHGVALDDFVDSNAIDGVVKGKRKIGTVLIALMEVHFYQWHVNWKASNAWKMFITWGPRCSNRVFPSWIEMFLVLQEVYEALQWQTSRTLAQWM